MALIGTISGSVEMGGSLVSATAISGTLVIADSPASVFPTLPTDVKFFVSGVQGAIAASLPGVAVFGGDLRVSGSSYFNDIDVTGHGAVIVQPYGTSTGQTGEVRFKELAANGGNYTALKAVDSISANLVLTLPAADGVNGNILKTSGTGVTSFVDASSVVTGTLSLVSINASSDITGSNLLINGDITGSNLRLTGDIAVVGGDITTIASTFNFLTTNVTTLNIGPTSTASTMNINGTNNQSQTNIACGLNSNVAATKTVNIGSGTASTTTCNINIGSSGALGRTNLFQDVVVGSGNIIGALGTFGNVFNLISSGNVIAKLDTNNDAEGHKFAVQDWRNIDQFTVGENGNAEISGSLVVSGSSLQTVTTTTFNLLTTALTGTLNVGSLTNTISLGGTTTTSSFSGDIAVSGRTNVTTVVERIATSNGGTGTVSFDLGVQGIFYVNNPTGNITANFTNVPTTTNRVITPTVILSQSVGASRPIVSAVQINGSSQTINWANGVTPTGNSGKQDVFGFSLIRSGSAGSEVWKVLGQMSTYG